MGGKCGSRAGVKVKPSQQDSFVDLTALVPGLMLNVISEMRKARGGAGLKGNL
jgi:hypothetical protein